VCYQSRCPGLYGYQWVVLTEVLDARIDADQPGAELAESGQQEPALLAK